MAVCMKFRNFGIMKPDHRNWSNEIAKGILKSLAVVVLVLILIWFVSKVYPVIVYLVLAGVLVLLGLPVKRFLMRKLKFGNTGASVTVLVFFSLVLLTIGLLFVPLLVQQGENLSVLNSAGFQQKISASLRALNEYLRSKNIEISDQFSLMELFKHINLTVIPQVLGSVIGILGNVAVGLFSVLFITFFLLKDTAQIKSLLQRVFPSDEKQRYERVMQKIKRLMTNYLAGLMLQIFILFVIYNVSLHLTGIPNATIIAFLAALLNLIPYVGPLISLILMITLSITSQLTSDAVSIDFSKIKYILLMYLIAQGIDNFFTQPFIYSRSVKSNPLEIFLVIITAGYIFGIWGMLIAVPTYTVLKILFKEFYTEFKHDFLTW